MAKTRQLYLTIAIMAVLGLVTFGVYARVLSHDFVTYDDDTYVTSNDKVKMGLTGESVTWAITTPHGANWHPVTWISHMVDIELYGLWAGGHHLTSLLIHIANTLLLFWVFKRMTGADWPSAFVAAVFALHPMHVESVAWVAERKDMLSGFFWLLAMAAYVYYTERRGVGRYVLVMVALALGLMSKAMLVTMPFVLLLMDYWPLKRFGLAGEKTKDQLSVKRLIVEKVPLFGVVIASCIVTFITQRSAGAMILKHVELSQRIANAFMAYVMYIVKTIWPTNLAVLYHYPDVPYQLWKTLAAVGVLAVIFVIAMINIRKRRYAAMGYFWFLGTLVPVIGIVQVGIQSRADRYMYIPMIGLSVIAAFWVWQMVEDSRRKRIATGIVGIAAVVSMSVLTMGQVSHWKDDFALYGHTIAVEGSTAVMHNNIGASYLEAGDVETAIEHLLISVEMNPNDPLALNNIGKAYMAQDKIDSAKYYFVRAVEVYPDKPRGRCNLASLLIKEKKYQEAAGHLQFVMKNNPEYGQAYFLMGGIYYEHGQYGQALGFYKKAVEVEPNQALSQIGMGETLFQLGRYDEAMVYFQKAYELAPELAAVYDNFGIIYTVRGDYVRARENFEKALELDPEFENAKKNLKGLELTIEEEKRGD